jgi:hypothetical protein
MTNKSGLATVLTFVVMRESYAPVILERKAAKLRKETGNANLRSKFDKGTGHFELLKISFIRPMKLLVFSPIVLPLTIYVSFTYGIIYFLFTTYTFVYTEKYHFNFGEVGLTYIPIGIGMLFGIWYLGRYSDRNIVKKRQAGLPVKAEDRIAPKLSLPGSLAFPIGIFIYGWTVQFNVHWIAPMIAQVLIGYGMISIFVSSPLSILWLFEPNPLRIADYHPELSRRCLHCIRRVSHRGQHNRTLHFRRLVAPFWSENVRRTWVRLGQLFARFYRAGYGDRAPLFLQVWREDQEYAAVSIEAIRGASSMFESVSLWLGSYSVMCLLEMVCQISLHSSLLEA